MKRLRLDCAKAPSRVALAAALVLFAHPALAQNVVVNGGFDDVPAAAPPSPEPPWVFAGTAGGANAGGLAFSPPNVAVVGGAAGGLTAPGLASQTLNVLRGGVYRLTYYAQNFTTAAIPSISYTLTSSLDGRPILTSVLGPNTANTYRQLASLVRVRRGAPLLSFLSTPATFTNDLGFLLLDDVSLVFLRSLSRPIDFRRLDLTPNQREVAEALYNATRAPGARRGPLYRALTKLASAQVPAVLDALSGEGIAAAQNIAFRSSQLFTSAVFDQTTFYNGGAANAITLSEPQPAFVALSAAQGQPVRELADLPSRRSEPAMPTLAPARTWRAWATGLGATEDIRGNAGPGSAGQANTLYGGALGVDFQLTPDLLAGVALGGTDGDFRIAGRGTSGSTTGGHVAIYDIYNRGAWYGASSASFSYFTNRTTRLAAGLGAGSETNRGSFDSHEVRARIEAGRHFGGLGGTVTPFVALELAGLRSNGFGETPVSGAGLSRLAVTGQSVADVPAFVGVRLQRAMVLGNNLVVSPTLQVAYVHEFAPYRSRVGQLVNLPGAIFLVDGARPARNAAQVKAGGELHVGARASLFANFEGEFSGVNQLYAGKGGFRYVW